MAVSQATQNPAAQYPTIPTRPASTLAAIVLLWLAFYASFTLFAPALLDDADSVHAEVAREMLLRHDYVTLYANGIRYLEKAPLLYWVMALFMRLSQLFGATSPRALAAAARLAVASDVLGLALFTEILARLIFRSARAGLYAALITLSSFGIFLFTRITIPDAGVCLWTTLALLAFWRTEDGTTEAGAPGPDSRTRDHATTNLRPHSILFATACALNVLTKGLIGLVFPIAIVLIYLLLTRGLRNTVKRLRELHPITTLAVFLLIAAPWHIAAGLANPTQGHPAAFHFIQGHWQVPLPTDGNVRGWFWFYFMNEHLLRYLNLRVPHDYDTAPLWLFWGLILIWLMPWSAFLFKALAEPISQWAHAIRIRLTTPSRILSLQTPQPDHAKTLLLIWAALPLLFFSLSTRQEYYVLPALPALILLIAGWLSLEQTQIRHPERRLAPLPLRAAVEGPAQPLALANPSSPFSTSKATGGPFMRSHLAHEWGTPTARANQRITTVLLTLGTLFAAATLYFLAHTTKPAPTTDLSTLLAQNPGDYALSMGHFLDLNAQALSLFRIPLIIAAIALFFGPLAALILRKRANPHAANLALAAGAFTFLLAAHLGLQTFAPVLTSAQLAQAIAPQVHGNDLIIIHGEYEAGSTLGFYLKRPNNIIVENFSHPLAPDTGFIHILEGRSSNLWYGSFFPDAPHIFETPESLAQKWTQPQRIFLWQSLTDPPNQLPSLPGPVYILVKSGGKEILSNQPNR